MAIRAKGTGSWSFQIPDLIALYSETYKPTTDLWRDLCAIDKAGHIIDLSNNYVSSITSVLEVGCGTG